MTLRNFFAPIEDVFRVPECRAYEIFPSAARAMAAPAKLALNLAEGRSLRGLVESICTQPEQTVDALQKHLQGFPLTEWEEDGTPLMVAAKYGRADLLDILIASGASPNLVGRPSLDSNRGVFSAVDRWMHGEASALYIAAQEGHGECVSLLILAGAHVNFEHTIDGSTPLIASCEAGHQGCAARLLSAGADAKHPRWKDGRTALGAACASGHYECARLLCTKGASIDVAEDLGEGMGDTPFDLAVQHIRSRASPSHMTEACLAMLAPVRWKALHEDGPLLSSYPRVLTENWRAWCMLWRFRCQPMPVRASPNWSPRCDYSPSHQAAFLPHAGVAPLGIDSRSLLPSTAPSSPHISTCATTVSFVPLMCLPTGAHCFHPVLPFPPHPSPRTHNNGHPPSPPHAPPCHLCLSHPPLTPFTRKTTPRTLSSLTHALTCGHEDSRSPCVLAHLPYPPSPSLHLAMCFQVRLLDEKWTASVTELHETKQQLALARRASGLPSTGELATSETPRSRAARDAHRRQESARRREEGRSGEGGSQDGHSIEQLQSADGQASSVSTLDPTGALGADPPSAAAAAAAADGASAAPAAPVAAPAHVATDGSRAGMVSFRSMPADKQESIREAQKAKKQAKVSKKQAKKQPKGAADAADTSSDQDSSRAADGVKDGVEGGALADKRKIFNQMKALRSAPLKVDEARALADGKPASTSSAAPAAASQSSNRTNGSGSHRGATGGSSARGKVKAKPTAGMRKMAVEEIEDEGGAASARKGSKSPGDVSSRKSPSPSSARGKKSKGKPGSGSKKGKKEPAVPAAMRHRFATEVAAEDEGAGTARDGEESARGAETGTPVTHPQLLPQVQIPPATPASAESDKDRFSELIQLSARAFLEAKRSGNTPRANAPAASSGHVVPAVKKLNIDKVAPKSDVVLTESYRLIPAAEANKAATALQLSARAFLGRQGSKREAFASLPPEKQEAIKEAHKADKIAKKLAKKQVKSPEEALEYLQLSARAFLEAKRSGNTPRANAPAASSGHVVPAVKKLNVEAVAQTTAQANGPPSDQPMLLTESYRLVPASEMPANVREAYL